MYSGDLTLSHFRTVIVQVSLRKCASSPEKSVVLKFIIIETKI